jgi:DNA-binding NarL/FixJ family response regulator
LKLHTILVDDNQDFITRMRRFLERQENVHLIAEATNGEDAILLVDKHIPNLILTDISMPGMNGFELIDYIHKKYPSIKIIMITVHANRDYIERALLSGVSGYVLKNQVYEDLPTAINTVMKNRQFVSDF